MSPIQLFVLNHESKSYNIDLHVEKKVQSNLWLYPKYTYTCISKKNPLFFSNKYFLWTKSNREQKGLIFKSLTFCQNYHTSKITSYFKQNVHRIVKTVHIWGCDIIFSLRYQGFYSHVPLRSWRHLGEGSSVEPTVHGDCSVVGSQLTTICLWIWILSQFQKAEEKSKS